jgi:hypothetical protein
MRYNDAKCSRTDRWIEGPVGLNVARVSSHATFGQAMSSDLVAKGAVSTV